MKLFGFRQLPTWWVRDEESLRRFKGGRWSGESIAALKSLLAINTLCEMSGSSAQVSYQGLMTLTGLSRPMIARGTKALESKGLVSVSRSGYINNYHLICLSDDRRWAKAPCVKIQENLAGLPNRGEASLAALKIYVYLLSIRPNTEREVSVSYKKISGSTGVQEKWIRPGLNLLFSNFLIHVRKVEGFSPEVFDLVGQYSYNQYTITGDLRVGQSHIR